MPDLLIACGRMLYGQQWQSALARDLGVSGRTMRRWVAGDSPVPPGLYVDLKALVAARRRGLKALAERLAAA